MTASRSDGAKKEPFCTKQRLFDDGLVGGKNSSELREKLAVSLRLPSHLSANALVEAINMLCSEEEYLAAMNAIAEDGSASVQQ